MLDRSTRLLPAVARPVVAWRSLRRASLVLLVAAALVCVLVGVARDGAQLAAGRWTLRPWRLAGATLLELSALAWGVYLWSRVLAGFEGAQPTYRGLLHAWRASTLAKYLPGSVWSAVSTVGMAARLGASPVALPSSFLIQGALSLTGALAVAALFGRRVVGAGSLAVPSWLAAAAVAGALALVHPVVLNALVGRVSRLARREAPVWRATWAAGATLLLLYMVTWAVYGAAFALFLSALTPTAGVPWVQLAGWNALAFAAGFVAFFAPGGLGVREAALVGLLAGIVPGLRARVALAAASRLWLALTEVAGGALVVVAGRPGTVPGGRAEPWTPARSDDRATWSSMPGQRSAAASRPAVLRDVRVDLLTDTRAALVDIVAACDAATRSIWIAQLAFDADCATGEGAGASTLLETIVAAAQRPTRDGTPLDVRIVLNGGLLLDTSPALRRAIAALGAGPNVQVRTVKAFPQVMHAKVLVVDAADAFLTGASFVNGYWDDARHAAAGAPDAGAGTGDRPLHDVAVRLRGSAAYALGEWFADLWSGAAGGDAAPPTMPPPAPDAAVGGASVQVLRTLPDAVPTRGARTEILDAYLDAIGRARSCIYLESQYFSARPIARAVRAALDAHPALELILVLNQNPDVTAYRAWQDARLAEHGLLDHARVGVFALWSATASRRAPGAAELTQVFVHSKVATIDDAWATLGTANLDGASLHSYGDDFASWPGRRAFVGYRNYDLNVALLDGVDGEPRTGVAAALRRRLWSRHLGLPEHALSERPADGWLPLWRERAAAHVAALAAGGRPAPAGRALPYAPTAHPRAQLRALGIDVERAGLDLRFDPSWLEVHCSPGWMVKLLPERMRRWRLERSSAVPRPARVRDDFARFVRHEDYPCLGARSALRRGGCRVAVYAGMGADDTTTALATDLAAFAGATPSEPDFGTFAALFVQTAPEIRGVLRVARSGTSSRASARSTRHGVGRRRDATIRTTRTSPSASRTPRSSWSGCTRRARASRGASAGPRSCSIRTRSSSGCAPSSASSGCGRRSARATSRCRATSTRTSPTSASAPRRDSIPGARPTTRGAVPFTAHQPMTPTTLPSRAAHRASRFAVRRGELVRIDRSDRRAGVRPRELRARATGGVALVRPHDRLREHDLPHDRPHAVLQPQPADVDDRRGHGRPSRLPAHAVQPGHVPILYGTTGRTRAASGTWPSTSRRSASRPTRSRRRSTSS